ncbi:MAG TPA: ATP-binding protein [Saprospiraceae bacterium]|nr:ATP-binding protein [Saprospiraceae bacterium]HMP25602.1 ATP-binding protein [Saprospiraceae bacterium]
MTRYPFKFLDAYTYEDREFFFGRDEEVEQLYEMVFQSDLLLVYGASGTGKSSLIQCGLAGKFQSHDWLALNVRRGGNLNESLDQALRSAGSAEDTDLPDWLDEDLSADISVPTAAPASPMARRLRAVYLRHFKPLYLIFDQFEELYTLGSKDEEQTFIATVREILRVEQPVKIILSIREEYLGHLYEFERQVPELLRKKLRIEPMFTDRVQQVILGVGSLPQSNVKLQAGEETAIATRIFEKLRGQDKTLSIQLPYLQVLLDKYYLHCTGDESRQAEATFTLASLDTLGDLGDVLRNFLDEQVQHIARQLTQPVETLWQLLSPFVTLDGTKEPLSEAELRSRLPEGFPAPTIVAALQAFVQRRVLRYMEQTARYEVAHDTLAKQLHARRSDEEIALLEVQRLIRSQVAIKAEAREYFSAKQLAFILEVRPKLRLTAEEKAWIEESRRYREQEAQAEAERQRVELAEAKQRLRVVRGLLALAVLAVLVAGYFAYSANVQRQVANAKTEEAQKERSKAETALSNFLIEQAEKERLNFTNLEARVNTIIRAGGCPDDLIKDMSSIAQIHPDSTDMRNTIRSIQSKTSCQ